MTVLAALGLVAAVAVGFTLHVQLPGGGRLTVGHAVVVAVMARAEPAEAVVICAAGLVCSLPWSLRAAESGRLGARVGAAALGAAIAVALGARLVADALVPADVVGDHRAIARSALVGVAFLATDHLGRRLATRGRPGSGVGGAWPLYVTLLCVAMLIDLAARRSIGLALVAAVPLVVTRFSFQRYTSARVTYDQTTMALALLPEVAGLTPLGHGERTAAYVEAVAPALGFDARRVDQLTKAARLHHIGHISLHEEAEREGPPDPSALAAVSVEILRETGFLGELVELVEDAQTGGPPASSLDAAVIRVSSMLDELVEEGDAFDPFASLVAMHPVGHERAVAIELLSLHHRRPGLVADASRRAEHLHRVAASAATDHRHH